MNWLDGVLIVVITASAYLGLRTGLLSAAFTAIGVWVGIAVAGRSSDDLAGWVTTSISNDTLVTVTAFAFIVIAAILAARIAAAAVKKAVGLLFLGFADPLGGALLGALAGVILSAALITGMARLAYDFESPVVAVEDEGGEQPASEGETPSQGGRVVVVVEPVRRVTHATLQDAEGVTLIDRTRGYVEGPLLGSAFAAAFVDVVDVLPGEVLGLVPSDFKDALDILEVRIELKDGERSSG